MRAGARLKLLWTYSKLRGLFEHEADDALPPPLKPASGALIQARPALQ